MRSAALTEALRLAVKPGPDAWTRLTSLATALADPEIDPLDAALGAWPDDLRLAPRGWGVRAWPEDRLPYCPPALRLARRLEIRREPLLDEDVVALLGSGHLQNLRQLWLDDNGLTHAALRTLASTDGLPALRWLGVSGGNVDDPGLALLAEGQWPALETLSLPSNGLTDAAFAQLRAGVWPTIRELVLADNAVGDDAVSALERVGVLHGLRGLQFAGCSVGDDGLRAIASASRGLEVLALQGCPVHDDGMVALARSEQRPKRLDLSETRISVDGVRALVDSPASDQLEDLALSWLQLGRAGAELLANARHLGRLVTLRVVGAGLGNDELAALVRGPGLPALRRVDARSNTVDDTGMAQLAQLPELQRLERVYLAGNPIDAAPALAPLDLTTNDGADSGG